MKINNNIEDLKIPPHSNEAEQGVLGGLMIRNTAFDEITDKIFEDVFYREDHKLIFKAIAYLFEKNKPMDVITVSEILESRNKLDDVGGLVYLGTLARDTPSASNIKAYADIVHEKYLLRGAIQIAYELAESAYAAQDTSAIEIIAEAEKSIFSLVEGGQKTGPQKADEHLPELVLELEQRFSSGGALIGLETGLSFIDGMTSGLQSGDLAILPRVRLGAKQGLLGT